MLSPAATWRSTNAWGWLDGFRAACVVPISTASAPTVYTGDNKADSILSMIDNIQKTEEAHGLSLPLTISEAGWGLNDAILDEDAQPLSVG